MAWTAPDTGGSELLNYKLYRSLAATGGCPDAAAGRFTALRRSPRSETG